MADLILHQYATSPFSEKIRLLMGAKGLAWQAVEIPPILPKPDVVALTGGYRRTPILQVGADIYCDTALICEVISSVAPARRAVPRGAGGQRACRRELVRCAVHRRRGLTCSSPAGAQSMLGHLTPAQIQAFAADRKAMRGDTNALRMPLARGHRAAARNLRPAGAAIHCRRGARGGARAVGGGFLAAITTSGLSGAPANWPGCWTRIRAVQAWYVTACRPAADGTVRVIGSRGRADADATHRSAGADRWGGGRQRF
ncbi:glutathione S-transferase N-terminal domain-containing protein [Cupriavidus basilensis]